MIEGSCLCGALEWTFEGVPEGATACNCTACRRYGALWAYDYEGEGISVSGPAQPFARGTALTFNFCPTCGCIASRRTMCEGLLVLIAASTQGAILTSSCRRTTIFHWSPSR